MIDRAQLAEVRCGENFRRLLSELRTAECCWGCGNGPAEGQVLQEQTIKGLLGCVEMLGLFSRGQCQDGGSPSTGRIPELRKLRKWRLEPRKGVRPARLTQLVSSHTPGVLTPEQDFSHPSHCLDYLPRPICKPRQPIATCLHRGRGT